MFKISIIFLLNLKNIKFDLIYVNNLVFNKNIIIIS